MDYTLDNVVKEYLIEIGDTQLNKYARHYQHAVSGLREFNMDSSGIIKVLQLAIKPNDTADLPLDYLQYTKIGLIGEDGNVYALGKNDSISLTKSFDNCGAPISGIKASQTNPTLASLTNGIYFGDNGMSYRNGQFMGRIFGLQGGINPYGEYRIDRANQVILLSRLFVQNFTNSPDLLDIGDNVTPHQSSNAMRPTSIVLEYLADIDSIDGDFAVHPFMVEALKSWMYYKSIQRDRARGNGEKEIARRDYYAEARWTKKRFTQSTVSEWIAAFRSGNTASVKW